MAKKMSILGGNNFLKNFCYPRNYPQNFLDVARKPKTNGDSKFSKSKVPQGFFVPCGTSLNNNLVGMRGFEPPTP